MDDKKLLRLVQRLEAKNPDFERIRVYGDYKYQVIKGGEGE